MSDSNPGGTPPQDPYGRPPGGENPYGQPPAEQQPAVPPPPENPYGQAPYADQPPPAQPYGHPQGQPYGEPPAANPYGQQSYGAPYAQQPPTGPLGDGLDMYGRPLTQAPRPGTVTAAGWITLVLSGLTGVVFAFVTVGMLVAKNDVVTEMDKAFAEQGVTGDFSAEDAYGFFVFVLVVLTLWCFIACLLAVFAMRGSNVSRILLVISAVVAALLSLVAIGSGISAVWLLACVAVVVLLFTGGAGDWYRRRRGY